MALVIIKDTDPSAPVLTGANATGTMLNVLDAGLIVNHVFGTSDDAAFTNQTTEARLEGGTAFNLLLTNVAAARLYIGMPVPFFRTKFSFTVNGVAGTYVFEYWNGAAFTAFTPTTNTTTGFTTNGTVTWTAALTTGWVANTVNAVNQFWIRIRATVTPSTNPTISFLTVGGWTRAFSGTNIAAYRQGTGSNGFLLRVADDGAGTAVPTPATAARTTGFETMTDVNTGTGHFPSTTQIVGPNPPAGTLYWIKSGSNDATSRPYILAASEKLFHLYVNGNSNAAGSNGIFLSFGDIKTYKSGDAFHTIHIGRGDGAAPVGTPVGNTMGSLAVNPAAITAINTGGHCMARTYTQLGAAILVSKTSDSSKGNTTIIGGPSSNLAYPHPVDGGLYLAPIWINEASTTVRGELPGLWNPLHNQPLTHLDTFSGTGTLAGRTFMAITQQAATGPGSQIFLETSDTWNV